MKEKLLYMTYDDAPVKDFKAKIDYLESKGIKAIWYCQGNNLEKYPQEAVYAIKKGHVLGNHSYDHPNFSEITLEEAKSQIIRTEELIDNAYREANVTRPYKTFRFPYLDTGEGDTGDPVNLDHQHTKELQEFLVEVGFVEPPFEGITYQWYKDMSYDKTISMECTYDSFDWCIGLEEPFMGYSTYQDILNRIDEDKPNEGRGLGHNISNEIVMNHAFVEYEYFKGIVDKLCQVQGRFAKIV